MTDALPLATTSLADIGQRLARVLAEHDCESLPEADRVFLIALAKDFDSRWASYPRNTSARSDAALDFVSPIVVALRDQPRRIASGAGMMALFLRAPDDIPLYERSVSLAGYFLFHVLSPASAEFQANFFRLIECDFPLLLALRQVIPLLDLLPHVAAAALARLDSLTDGDGMRGQVMAGMVEWASTHADAAKSIVDAYLDRAEWATPLNAEALPMLIEAAMRSVPDPSDWRRLLLDQLLNPKDERLLGIAPETACYAWPSPEPPVADRHDALLCVAAQLPPRLLPRTILAIARDVEEYPVETLATVTRLIDLSQIVLPPPRELPLAPATAITVDALLKSATRLGLSLVLPPSIETTILSAPPGTHQIEWCLDTLAATDPQAATGLLERWIRRHSNGIATQQVSAPRLVDTLNAPDRTSLITRILVDNDPMVRLAGAILISSDASRSPTEADLRALSLQQAEALAYHLVASNIHASAFVPLLLLLTQVHPALSSTIAGLCCDVVYPEYPRLCETLIINREQDFANCPPILSLIGELKVAALAYTRVVEAKRVIPELSSWSPARDSWLRVEELVARRAMEVERQSGRYVFLALATRIPIGRGSSFALGLDDLSSPAAVQEISHQMEVPLRSTLDPMSNHLTRERLRVRCQQLLSSRPDGE